MLPIEHDYAFEPEQIKAALPRANRRKVAGMGDIYQLGQIIKETGALDPVNSMDLARRILEHPDSRWSAGSRFRWPWL